MTCATADQAKPAPESPMNWHAFYTHHQPGDPIGRGASDALALRDLQDKLIQPDEQGDAP